MCRDARCHITWNSAPSSGGSTWLECRWLIMTVVIGFWFDGNWPSLTISLAGATYDTATSIGYEAIVPAEAAIMAIGAWAKKACWSHNATVPAAWPMNSWKLKFYIGSVANEVLNSHHKPTHIVFRIQKY